MALYGRPVAMEESVEGVDWHRDGVDCHGWLVALLVAAMALPVAGAGALIVVGWIG